MADRHTIPQIEAALHRANGRPAVAARILGISRQAMHERIVRTPHLREVIEEIEQTLLDLAEGAIIKAIRAGHFPTIKWFLDRRGRSRGYGRGRPAETCSISQEQAEQLVLALGGDVEIYRKTLRELQGD